MFLTGFKIKDCLYITNKEIRSIEANMKESMQLILGTNGSGKSVLCRLLTGWPPKPKAFKTGGFFEMTFKSGLNDYLIRYDFTKSVKCTFVKNEEVLNDKSTTTVQKDLLKEHLKIDQDVYKLLTGEANFTKMTTNERKRWIDKVAPIDMGYITGIYDKVRRAGRDVKGAIKVNTDRMHREQTRLDALGLPDNIEQEYEEMNERFINLTREHDVNFGSSTAYTNRINTLHSEIQDGVRQLVELRRKSDTFTNDGITTFGDLDSRLTYLRVQDNSLVAESEAIMTDVQRLDKILHTFKGPSGGNLDDLKESLEGYRKAIQDVKSVYKGDYPFSLTLDSHNLANSIYEFEGIVRKLATDMPNNSKPVWYTREKAMQLHDRMHELKTNAVNMDDKLHRMNDKLRDMKSSRLIDCPNCSHSFHLGFTKDDVARLEAAIEKLGGEREIVHTELTKVIKQCEEIDTYRDAGKLFNTAKSISMQHAGFWVHVQDQDYLGTNPSRLNQDLIRYTEVIGDLRSIHITQIEVDRIEQTIANMAGLGGNDADSIRAKYDALMANREALLNTVEANRKEATRLNTFRTLAFKQQQLLEDIQSKNAEIEKLLGKISIACHHEVIGEEIDRVVGRLATIRESVNKKEVLNGVIANMKRQQEEIIQQQEDWVALQALLSPESGLIAHHVNSYIGGFITLMNQTVNAIWTYPVDIQPCTIDSGGLNYLFPVMMPTRRSSPDDVSECSKGQREVIDFAFQVAVYRCLELDHLPLFTDELGSAFDEEHSSKLMVYLNRLLDSGQAKQIFMVNHFQEMHGSLKNAEVLVLDEDNVTAPVSANEHVVFNKL